MKKVFTLLAHFEKNSLNGRIADICEQYLAKTHEIRRQNLSEMNFNPILERGYRQIQPLEPDLVKFQKNLVWCDHFILIYPMWWGCFPAKLKGLFDRAILPKFAFKYHQNDSLWDRLLIGKTAQIISTSDGLNIWNILAYHNADFRLLKKAILGFCGFKPVKCHRISNVKRLSKQQINDKLEYLIKKLLKRV